MPRTNQDGKDIRQVLEWLCRRRITEVELAGALDIPTSSYKRRSEGAEDFPTFEELERLGEHFNINKRALQIAFGLRDQDELCLLDDDGMRQFIEQGGGEPPLFPMPGRATTRVHVAEHRSRRRRQRRGDAPPL